jgi:hypothetical protein
VEPTSMVWFLGQKAEDRQGTTWFKALNADYRGAKSTLNSL